MLQSREPGRRRRRGNRLAPLSTRGGTPLRVTGATPGPGSPRAATDSAARWRSPTPKAAPASPRCRLRARDHQLAPV